MEKKKAYLVYQSIITSIISIIRFSQSISDKLASIHARRTARIWRNTCTAANKQAHREAQQTLDETVRKAQRRAWRNAVAKASKDNKAIWKIKRWARLRSHLPIEPLRIPDLDTGDPQQPTATTHV